MIKFHEIKYKNFLSTGDKFTTIHLDKSPSTLIVGENGAGKSTIVDALSFALFGCAHRNINKNQLINSVNQKGLLVEVTFTIGKKRFKVIRGIKPNVFEIYQGKTMINQTSTVKDYQKHLEQVILKLNHKSFHQIVVLGSSSFIPFMQLPTYIRREVIEDLLDIQIFSKMRNVLKDKYNNMRDELTDITYNITSTEQAIQLSRKHIQEIISLNENHNQSKLAMIEENETKIASLKAANDIYIKSWYDKENQLTRLIENKDLISKLNEYLMEYRTEIRKLNSELNLYNKNLVCPTCDQDISENHKINKVETIEERLSQLNEGVRLGQDKIIELNQTVKMLEDRLEDIRIDEQYVANNNEVINVLEEQIKNIRKDMNIVSVETYDISEANKTLTELIDKKDKYINAKNNLSSQRLYFDAAIEMLKDTGIKTKIIKEYLPVMNTLINKYLQILDFFVSFNLDESFSEEIRSRYRDTFKYESFSEGEKMKIDLSLLFTWRQIAKMKNSAATNLLILDETFDSSLDQDGIDNVIKILNTFDQDTNIFVISHRGDQLDSKFRNKITFVKDRNFSSILE